MQGRSRFSQPANQHRSGGLSFAISGLAGLLLAAPVLTGHSQSLSFSTVAGYSGTASADGTGVAARFVNPWGVAVDTSGNLYVADTDNHTIRKISPAGVVSTLAGQPGVSGSSNGTGSGALFNSPQ